MPRTVDKAGFADGSLRRAFRRRLMSWYRRNARDLPWRQTRDAYRVWVSEIMLQQTQVATVVPYFQRFVARFPSIAALAKADEEEVLRLWEGLGYYRRARQLHAAAKAIVAEHRGRFPQDAEAVRRLPGIGRYTAGAILSIAFNAREPVLEANTVRLLSRLLGYRGDPRKAAGQRLLWATAANLLPRSGSGTFNQALMELGATVCTPRAPRCSACPVEGLCRTAQLSLQEQIPRRPKRPEMEKVQEAAIVVCRKGKVLLVKRREGERWAGLWDFPRFALRGADQRRFDVVAETLRTDFGVLAEVLSHLVTLRHTVTRFQISLACYLARFTAARPSISQRFVRWLRPAELSDLPLSVTGRKLAQLVLRRGARL